MISSTSSRAVTHLSHSAYLTKLLVVVPYFLFAGDANHHINGSDVRPISDTDRARSTDHNMVYAAHTTY